MVCFNILRVSIYQPFAWTTFGSIDIASGRKNRYAIAKKLPSSFGKMSINGTLNFDKIVICKEKWKIGVDVTARKRSLPAINVATFEKLKRQHPAEDIGNYLCSTDFNPDVANSFYEITRKS